MRRALTMLEVLVVLTIVILLAALLMPVFNRAKGRSHVAVCTSNLKQVYYALQLYRNDHGEYPKNSFHWSYWGGPGSDEAFKQLPCPAWKAFGCRFAESDDDSAVPWCEWWPYEAVWSGLYVFDGRGGKSLDPWTTCQTSRGDALPIAYDENHARERNLPTMRKAGAPVLILREGGQVTTHEAPMPFVDRGQDDACSYGSPFTW